MPFAIIPKTGDGPARGIGATESEAWENAGLEEEERVNYRAVPISKESYRKAVADPTPAEQLGD